MATSDPTLWYYHSAGGKKGPFNRDQMEGLIRAAELGAQDPIWRQGFESWMPLGASGDFNAALGRGPRSIVGAQMRTSEQIFDGLLRESWSRFQRRDQAQQVDEVLVGAVITATLDAGHALLNLASDGTFHYLRFEALESRERLIFQLRHLSTERVAAEVLGQEAQVTMSFGKPLKNFKKIWAGLQHTPRREFLREADPGTVTLEGDAEAQYLFAEVSMIWDINDYLMERGSYKVNYPKLTSHISAVQGCLGEYLDARVKRFERAAR